MKRERRHELQHNDLAEWISKGYEQIVPYGKTILGVALAVLALVVGWLVWCSHTAAQEDEALNKLGTPTVQPALILDRDLPRKMQEIIQTYPNTRAADWAKVFQAHVKLGDGANIIMTDRNAGKGLIDEARVLYEEAGKSNIPEVQEQALFGKARAIESLSEDEEGVAKAVKAYEELNRRFPNGMFKPIADQQIARLQKPQALEFYTHFAKPRPKLKSPRSMLEHLDSDLEPPVEHPVPTPFVRPESGQPPTGVVPGPSPAPTGSGNASTPAVPKTTAPNPEPAKPQAATSAAPKTTAPNPEPAKPQAATSAAPRTSVAKP